MGGKASGNTGRNCQRTGEDRGTGGRCGCAAGFFGRTGEFRVSAG